MGWKIHIPGKEPEKDKILARRFGRDHEWPCNRPEILTCALWECQAAGICQAEPKPIPQ